MDIFRAQNAAGLTDIRMQYLLEDFPEMTAEQAEHIREKLPEYYAEHLNCDFFAYIAEDNGTIIGSAFLVLIEMPPNSNFPNGKIGNVLNVYVNPQYRRQGIAKALMELLIADAKNMSLDYIELKASSDGYPLYKKLGFKENVSVFRPMKLVL
ncbi:GNAT family N-acetyltransferase [Ruminococcus sp.]|uniref:GNAT family N-acetyltransferase n=1 Tax=Ruminococcus sp. TaxID=41978 RepID=UPI0025FFD705|nr:GNAT family N-acetyltransferase [Ruminococcus sp.]MBO4523570.1 GNAT family N-acetyltransferase [Ruminococcus sp.]